MRESVRNFIARHFDGSRRWLVHDLKAMATTEVLLLGRLASWRVRSMQVLGSIQDVEFKVTSQWGEDGIIDWLVERAQIPPAARAFVEFGVESYAEANTRFLLENRNWRGFVMDGDASMLVAVEQAGLLSRYDLVAKQAFITRDNINQLITDAGFRGEIGLLSIDVDGNDYWIWEAIDVVRPILLICEYNAVLGDLHPVSVPYDPQFYRTAKHFSNLYFGASIGALRALGERKGYRFAGTTSAGNDAFFVREDYANRFLDASISDFGPVPSRAKESRTPSGGWTYIGGSDRVRVIEHLPIVNTETGETKLIKELGPIYSEQWASTMGF